MSVARVVRSDSWRFIWNTRNPNFTAFNYNNLILCVIISPNKELIRTLLTICLICLLFFAWFVGLFLTKCFPTHVDKDGQQVFTSLPCTTMEPKYIWTKASILFWPHYLDTKSTSPENQNYLTWQKWSFLLSFLAHVPLTWRWCCLWYCNQPVEGGHGLLASLLKL